MKELHIPIRIIFLSIFYLAILQSNVLLSISRNEIPFQQLLNEDSSKPLNQANKKYEKGVSKYKNFTDLYNQAVKHGNSDFLHNKQYILKLLDSSEFYCKEALKVYLQFKPTIDKVNSKTLESNISNTKKLLSNISVMNEKMKRFYNAKPGKSMQELNR